MISSSHPIKLSKWVLVVGVLRCVRFGCPRRELIERQNDLSLVVCHALGMILYQAIVIAMALEPLDPEYVADVLSRPPFVKIAGVHNVRDLGLYHFSYCGQITKPNFFFHPAGGASLVYMPTISCSSTLLPRLRSGADEGSWYYSSI
jgi:hypothetical protein